MTSQQPTTTHPTERGQRVQFTSPDGKAETGTARGFTNDTDLTMRLVDVQFDDGTWCAVPVTRCTVIADNLPADVADAFEAFADLAWTERGNDWQQFCHEVAAADPDDMATEIGLAWESVHGTYPDDNTLAAIAGHVPALLVILAESPR